MSSITFNTPSGSAVLRGSERAHLAILVEQIGLSVLDVARLRPELTRCLPLDHYLRKASGPDAQWAQWFRTAAKVGDLTLRVGGQDVSMWHVILNTALTFGNDQIILAARIHAQCEIHAWIGYEWEKRDRIATIIEEGLETGIFRKDQGWVEIIYLLRRDVDEPVVMSYSVTESFPNPQIAGISWEDEEACEEFEDQPIEVQWKQAFDALKKSGGHRELDLEEWYDFRFGDGIDALQLAEMLSEKRIRFSA